VFVKFNNQKRKRIENVEPSLVHGQLVRLMTANDFQAHNYASEYNKNSAKRNTGNHCKQLFHLHCAESWNLVNESHWNAPHGKYKKKTKKEKTEIAQSTPTHTPQKKN